MLKVENINIVYLDEGDFITGQDVKDLNINSGLLPDVDKEVMLAQLVIYKGKVLKDRNNPIQGGFIS